MHFDFEENIILESDSLLLRHVSKEDTENLIHIATADKSLLQFSPRQIYTRELLEKYIENAIVSRLNKSRYSFVIFSKTLNRFVGSTAFLNVSNPDDRLEIGATFIDKQLHGTGLNKECKHLMLQYAFNSLHANRVEFKTDERNIRSCKAIEKIGGKLEGILREHTLMYDGFRRNTFCYSILKSEWASLQF